MIKIQKPTTQKVVGNFFGVFEISPDVGDRANNFLLKLRENSWYVAHNSETFLISYSDTKSSPFAER